MIQQIQEDYYGKRGFVLGGGASIKTLLQNNFNFSQLTKDEIVIGINKAYRLCEPQILVSIDIHFLRDSSEDLKYLPQTLKIIPDICCHYFEKDDPTILCVTDPCRPKYRSHRRTDLPHSWNTFCYAGGSGLFGLKIACLLGLNPIYLLGFDCKQTGGFSHFHNEYGVPLTNNKLKQFSMNIINFSNRMKKEKDVQVYVCSDSLLIPHLKYKNINKVLSRDEK